MEESNIVYTIFNNGNTKRGSTNQCMYESVRVILGLYNINVTVEHMRDIIGLEPISNTEFNIDNQSNALEMLANVFNITVIVKYANYLNPIDCDTFNREFRLGNFEHSFGSGNNIVQIVAFGGHFEGVVEQRFLSVLNNNTVIRSSIGKFCKVLNNNIYQLDIDEITAFSSGFDSFGDYLGMLLNFNDCDNKELVANLESTIQVNKQLSEDLAVALSSSFDNVENYSNMLQSFNYCDNKKLITSLESTSHVNKQLSEDLAVALSSGFDNVEDYSNMLKSFNYCDNKKLITSLESTSHVNKQLSEDLAVALSSGFDNVEDYLNSLVI
jgi:copper homeostasis protein CutC